MQKTVLKFCRFHPYCHFRTFQNILVDFQEQFKNKKTSSRNFKPRVLLHLSPIDMSPILRIINWKSTQFFQNDKFPIHLKASPFTSPPSTTRNLLVQKIIYLFPLLSAWHWKWCQTKTSWRKRAHSSRRTKKNDWIRQNRFVSP